MKLNSFLVGVVLVLPILGCDKIVEPEEMTYDKKLVISAVLDAGKPIDQVLIGKTLPPDKPYIPLQAAVTSANCSISVDGASYTLTFVGIHDTYGQVNGMAVYSAQSLVAEPGKVYTIDVQTEGLHATATTLVPAPPVLDSIVLSNVIVSGTNYVVLDGQIAQQSGVVYSPAYSYTPSADVPVQNPVFGVGKSSPGYRMRFRIPVYGFEPSLHDSLTAVITSYDESYLDYFATRFNGYGSTSDLSQSLAPVKWNVHGDGIGLFIGAIVTKWKVTIP